MWGKYSTRHLQFCMNNHIDLSSIGRKIELTINKYKSHLSFQVRKELTRVYDDVIFIALDANHILSAFETK